MTIDHVGLKVSDFTKAVKLYEKALAPLGFVVDFLDEGAKLAGLGPKGAPVLWLSVGGKEKSQAHVALRGASAEHVQQFHAAAIAAGARDNGRPGPRPGYGPNYYAAFVLDLDGNNLEVVCHEPS